MDGSVSRPHKGSIVQARTSPTTIPPPPTSSKFRPASHNENVPAVTAISATLKATSPVPSFIRLSPPTTVPTRSGTPRRRKIASAATGSVGAKMAPSTNETAHGRPTAKWATAATAKVVAKTRPTARSVIALRWARRSSGEEKKAAEFNSGGKKTTKITSGGTSTTGNPGTKPSPSPPSTRKIGYGIFTTRANCASSAATPSRKMSDSIWSMHSFCRVGTAEGILQHAPQSTIRRAPRFGREASRNRYTAPQGREACFACGRERFDRRSEARGHLQDSCGAEGGSDPGGGAFREDTPDERPLPGAYRF